MNDLDDQLNRTLREHADGVHGAPLTFDDVRGRATSIRRRRRLASGLGVAAAIAVIVPTAMFATNGNDSSPQPATALPTVTDTNTPSPTSSSTPVMGSDPHALDVTGLPTGAPPAVPLVTGGALALASTAEASVRWMPEEGVVVEAGGRTFGPYPSSSGLALNEARTAIAWATDDGEVMTWQDGSPEPNTLPSPGLQGMRVVAVTGDGCVNGTSAGDCLVYVSGSDQDGVQKSVAIGRGTMSPVDPDGSIIGVRDANEAGRVLGITEVDDTRPGTCSVVVDPAQSGSRPLLDTCDYALDEFSPDGSYVLASDTYGDGIGSGTIAVFETDGDRLSYRNNHSSQDIRFYNSAVWEDDTHVLFTLFQDGRWSMVRMAVDGAMELAIAPQPGEAEEVPWHFETV
jgi:hypothetical protein